MCPGGGSAVFVGCHRPLRIRRAVGAGSGCGSRGPVGRLGRRQGPHRRSLKAAAQWRSEGPAPVPGGPGDYREYAMALASRAARRGGAGRRWLLIGVVVTLFVLLIDASL